MIEAEVARSENDDDEEEETMVSFFNFFLYETNA